MSCCTVSLWVFAEVLLLIRWPGSHIRGDWINYGADNRLRRYFLEWSVYSMDTDRVREHNSEDTLRYTIMPYEEKYRDDMIFMVLQAKDALGRVPGLNEDLLDIQKNYLYTGDMFWLAIDGRDRVVGCIGYKTIPNTTEVRLHRLYIKAARKRQGIGSDLLRTVERHLCDQGKTAVHVHLGGKEYFESRAFYPKHGYAEYAPDMMKKEL